MSFSIEDLLKFDTFFVDFDGTLVDSEPLHFQAHKKALSEHGFDLSMNFYIQHGMSRDPRLFYEDALEREINDDLYKSIRRIKKKSLMELQSDLRPMLCAIKLLKFLKDKNKKIWITSASGNDYVRENSKKIGMANIIDGFVCCDSNGVKLSKPAPDIFNIALSLSGSQLDKVLVIEDSVNGAKAAENADLKCLVFPNKFTNLQKLPDSAIISSCSELVTEK